MKKTKKLDSFDGIFAERFRTLMHKNKVKQSTIAKELNVSRQAISTYMDGSVLPNMQNLQKICNFFDVSSDYLLGFTISTSSDIDERQVSDIIGLNSIAVDRLKELHEANNDTSKNILSILNAFLFSNKPLTQLSDAFFNRFEAQYNYMQTEKRFREIEKNELNGKSLCEHEEALTLLENFDKLKKDIRWYTFLSTEFLDVIFDVYMQNLIEEKREKRCNNGNENK